MGNITLSVDQENALSAAMDFLTDPDETEMVISGHSGTGKSTLVTHLLSFINTHTRMINLVMGTDKADIAVYCTATTNKAAAVLSNITKKDAATIHSLLKLRVTNNYKTGKTTLTRKSTTNPIKNSLIIIDEASMVNIELLQLIRKCTTKCKVIYILDPYQMTALFEDTCCVHSDITNKSTLTSIQRQKETNGKLHPIAALGEQFRKTIETGIFPKIVPDGKHILHLNNEEMQDTVDQEFTNITNPNHAKILVWTNAKVNEYNGYVRSLHSNSDLVEVGEYVVTNKPILNGNSVVYPTDAIIQITAIEEEIEKYGITGHMVTLEDTATVFLPNEQWRVKEIIKGYRKEKDWVNLFEVTDACADLRATYACTVHKCQGSTYDIAFIDLENIGKCRNPVEVARLLYVAVTRATTQVVFYGNLPNKYRG